MFRFSVITRSRHLSNNSYFLNELDAGLSTHRVLHVANQVLNVARACITKIDNEVGVFQRHLRPANGVTLQSTRFDQPRRVIPRRIAEG